MAQMTLSFCDCCGLRVDHALVDFCPNCQYPVHPEKEQLFLETSIRDLRRVARYGGASIKVMDLVSRYEGRLHFLRTLKTSSSSLLVAGPEQPVQAAQMPPRVSPTWSSAQPDLQPAVALSVTRPLAASPVTGSPHISVQPAASMRGFALTGDAVVNIVAALGGFMILAGALGILLVTTNLWLSFLVVLAIHAVFGSTGLFVRRRFPVLRAVSTLYTLISALLVPLVAYSAYRLVTNGIVDLSIPLLLTLSALYAAVIYALLAIAQRFVPFAYLSIVALLVGDLALAQTLHLAYWWWPCVAMLLALVALVAVARPNGSGGLFAEERAILRVPLLVLMYSVVSAVVFFSLILLDNSLLADQQHLPVQEAHQALFSLSCLVLLWLALLVWRTRWTVITPLLACQLLGTFVLLGYVLNLDLTGYVVLLAGVALFYHVLVRAAGGRLTMYRFLDLTLDGLAIGLAFLVLLLVAAATPLQLLYGTYVAVFAPDALALSFTHLVPFVPGAGVGLDLLALGVCLLVTLDMALARTAFSRKPAGTGWCWLLVLSGLILASVYGLEVLLWHVYPLWAFLAFTIALLACVTLIRRFTSPAWANPLDLLVLCEIGFVMLLSFGQAPEIVGAILSGFAVLLYSVLLYQRRPLPSLLSSGLFLLALPSLLVHPIVVLVLSLLLPLVAAGLSRMRLFDGNSGTFMGLFAWTLLGPALVSGLVLASIDINGNQSVFAHWSGFHVAAAYEVAMLGVAWYAAALIARQKLWLVPATIFWLLAVVVPANTFWALSVLVPCLALAAAGIERRSVEYAVWALPFSLSALFSAGVVAYTGLMGDHMTEVSWLLLGYALLAYGLGVAADHVAALWLTPVFATIAVYIAAGMVGDLYRPPIVALAGAGLGLAISRFSWLTLVRVHRRRARLYALPFYVTALIAAILTGVYGMLGDINRPFFAALPDALFAYALVAFAVLWLERRVGGTWLVAIFACWGVLLIRQLTVSYILGYGVGLVVLGLLSEQLFHRASLTAKGRKRRGQTALAWSWPWYSAFLSMALVLGTGSFEVTQHPTFNPIPLGMLVFAMLALLIMLVKRAPELLIFPVGLATWTIDLWLSGSSAVQLILACTLLCVLTFALQFVWRFWPATTRWLAETSLHNALSIGGLCLVLLFAFSQGAISSDAGTLAQAGILALVTLSLLLFLYGLLHPSTVARALPRHLDEAVRVGRLAAAHAARHWCNYISGLLLTLALSWELLAFHQTRFDVLTLVPASYLIVVAPLLLRDQTLPGRHVVGQAVALAGSALLLLPALWFSFNSDGANLLPTLILLAEALVLLILGLVIRLRIFILSSTALVVVGTLRVLFLSMPPSIPIVLMVFGSLLMLLATALILARHRLQAAWRHWV